MRIHLLTSNFQTYLCLNNAVRCLTNYCLGLTFCRASSFLIACTGVELEELLEKSRYVLQSQSGKISWTEHHIDAEGASCAH